MSAPAGEASLGGPVDNEMSVGNEDPEATWQMPPPTPGAPQEALPAAGDLGGFEDFAAAPPAAAEPPAMDKTPPAPPMKQDEPPALAAPELGADPLAPDPPELVTTNEVSPVEMTPEAIPSVDTQATMDPVKAGADAFAPLPSTPEPANPEPPQVTEMPPAMSTEPEAPSPPVEPANDLETLDALAPPLASTPSEPEPAPEAPPAAPVMLPAKDAAIESPLPTADTQVPASSADDDLVERVAQRVVDKLSSKIIQEIAWEVVPDLAEGLIRREIDVLKSKIPKSG